MDLNSLTIKDLDALADNYDSLDKKSSDQVKRVIDAGDYVFYLIKDYGSIAQRENSPKFSVIEINNKLRADLRKWIDEKTASVGISFTGQELQCILDNSYTIQKKLRSLKVTRSLTISNKRIAFFGEPTVISSKKMSDGKWSLEVNIIDWGSGKTIDIRTWNEAHSRAKKGFAMGLEAFDTLLSYMRHAKEDYFS